MTNLQVTRHRASTPGLAPEEIERQVTVPLERVLNGTPQMICDAAARACSASSLVSPDLRRRRRSASKARTDGLTSGMATGRAARRRRACASARVPRRSARSISSASSATATTSPTCARARVERSPQVLPGARRRRRGRRSAASCTELHVEVDPSRLLAARPDARRRHRRAGALQPQRRRRLPAPRRSGAGRSAASATSAAARRTCSRLEERRRHAGHDRRHRHRSRVDQRSPRRGDVGCKSTTRPGQSRASRAAAARREPQRSCSTRHPEGRSSSNDKRSCRGHAASSRSTTAPIWSEHTLGDRSPQPAVRRAAGRRASSGCSCAACAAR